MKKKLCKMHDLYNKHNWEPITEVLQECSSCGKIAYSNGPITLAVPIKGSALSTEEFSYFNKKQVKELRQKKWDRTKYRKKVLKRLEKGITTLKFILEEE